MTILQISAVAGCLLGAGIALVLWWLAPPQPQLAAALERLYPDRTTISDVAVEASSLQDRIGLWLQRHVPLTGWARIPTRELRVLRKPVHRWLGEKAAYAMVGLVFPTVATVVLRLVGVTPPVLIPVAATLLLAAALSFLPDYNAYTDAKAARQEFTRALGAYIDLVALERAGGAGSTQALENAAQIGDSWVFQRLRDELGRARWAGTAPWDGLTELADELGLPELADLAGIMRLSGEEGATVYATLRARSAGLRTALLNDEHAKANAAAEKMTMPVAALSLIFLVLLAMPPVLRVVFGGS